MKSFNTFNFNKIIRSKWLWGLARPSREALAVAGKTRQRVATASRFVPILLTAVLLGTGCGSVMAAESVPPDDLVVGRIQIQSRDIFTREEVHEASALLRAMRRTMNGLHVNTHRWVIRQELLFSEGDPFRPEKLAETERNLRALGYLNEIRVAAIDTTADGRVNVLVSLRESWSLNTAVTYSRASGGNQRWSASLSDRNVLGNGFTLGAGLGSNEIGSFTNLWFRKRRVLGSPFVVGADFYQPTSGYYRGVALSRPFYAQDDAWSMGLLAWDSLSDRRYFLSNASPVGDDPTREASLYAELPMTQTGFGASAQFRLGGSGGRIWRVGAGARIVHTIHHVGDQPAWLLSDARWADLSFLLEPGQPMTRTQGTMVYPFLLIETLGSRWTKARFVRNYGPVEDLPLAWQVNLKFGPNGKAMGSTVSVEGSSYRAEVDLTRYQPVGGGIFRLLGSGYAQMGSPENRLYRYDLLAGWTQVRGGGDTPWLTRVHAEYGQGESLTPSEAFLLGLDRGIRTLEFDGMAGDRLARWNAEQGRVLPWTPLGLFKSGAAVFYSGGCAWWGDEDRNLGDARHEVGLGLRFGPTRSSGARTTRLDLTWNADDFSGGPVFTTVTRGTF